MEGSGEPSISTIVILGDIFLTDVSPIFVKENV